MLLLSGEAGAKGELELNGARHALKVPGRDAAGPAVVELGGGLLAVVVNERQAETAAVVEEGICLGVDPFGIVPDAEDTVDASDKPVPPAATLRPAGGHDQLIVVTPAGEIQRSKQTGPRRPPAPKLGSWDSRGTSSEVAGTARGYEAVPAVGTPARFDAAHGDAYGWLTLENPGAAAARTEPTHFPGGPGRLHVFADGKRVAVVGPGRRRQVRSGGRRSRREGHFSGGRRCAPGGGPAGARCPGPGCSAPGFEGDHPGQARRSRPPAHPTPSRSSPTCPAGAPRTHRWAPGSPTQSS